MLSLSSCANQTQLDQEVAALSIRLTDLEQQYKKDQATIARLNKAEADLNTIIEAISASSTMVGYTQNKTDQSTAIITPVSSSQTKSTLLTTNTISVQQPVSSADFSANATAKAQTDHQFAVQIATLSSIKQSKQAWQAFSTKFTRLTQSTQPIIEKINKDNIDLFRLKIGPYSKSNAEATCFKIKQAKRNCLIRTYVGQSLLTISTNDD